MSRHSNTTEYLPKCVSAVWMTRPVVKTNMRESLPKGRRLQQGMWDSSLRAERDGVRTLAGCLSLP
jgi:hypothetical protein